MAGLATSASISSFISWSTCSGHRSLAGLRSLATHAGTRRSNIANRRLLDRTATVTGASQIHKRHFHASTPLSAPRDPYQALGVKKDATAAEIKKTYFSLARKFHPDTNPDKNAREKFQEIQEAYEILKDDKKRAAYDQYGSASQQPGFDPDAFGQNPFGSGFPGFGGGFNPFFNASEGSQANLFEQLFGGGFAGGSRTRSQNAKGSDLEASIGISFMEACKGTKKTIEVTPVVDCSPCTGTGLKPGIKRTQCTACNGTGTRTFVVDSGFRMASTCQVCRGVGSVVPQGGNCASCDGLGKVRQQKSVVVNVPAGVEDGMGIRVSGAGDAPISGRGQPGDLIVRVRVLASKLFRRQGINIYHDARIPLHTALLGGRLRVPTLDGEVDVRVPAGTQQGEEMILKGHGLNRVMGHEKGDLFVTFSVQLPRSLTARQREILQQYADDVEGRTSGGTGPETSSHGVTGEPKETAGRRPNVKADDNDRSTKHEEGTGDKGSGHLENEKRRATA